MALPVFCLVFGTFLFAKEGFAYGAKGKRDPFIPLVTPDGRILKLEREDNASGLTLEGIIYDERGSSCALINAEIVGIGDVINGYEVLKIEKRKVILVKEGQVTEIELKEEEL